MKCVLVLAASVLLASVVPAAAQQKATTQSADQAFVREAAQGGMAEVELGKMATRKASSDEVKMFGQRMAEDHSKANDELKTLAETKHIALPSGIDAKSKALEDRLNGLSGPAFDRAYMQAMVSDHVKDVSVFRNESQRGKDSDIAAFAGKTLPTLEDHLTMAKKADKNVAAAPAKK